VNLLSPAPGKLLHESMSCKGGVINWDLKLRANEKRSVYITYQIDYPMGEKLTFDEDRIAKE